ncbi:uncharacterized protein K452DRAFT_312042 [Aplosporella prunicola CBS 121167]|uniref:Uncharacterized protein n=1 Tax=Aplosporella prunicola CBS 121167 TaxID=1176127 RepID=A0A6A6B144_9PEZI|nr:uncharacterized protein K452DRAFT_312042 [Aplosporella prunicola CBS 121167]KAF2137912.1 hypothetical protein K452DRAFT_312042 [Aplosporella prunicola CBS 121167]
MATAHASGGSAGTVEAGWTTVDDWVAGKYARPIIPRSPFIHLPHLPSHPQMILHLQTCACHLHAHLHTHSHPHPSWHAPTRSHTHVGMSGATSVREIAWLGPESAKDTPGQIRRTADEGDDDNNGHRASHARSTTSAASISNGDSGTSPTGPIVHHFFPLFREASRATSPRNMVDGGDASKRPTTTTVTRRQCPSCQIQQQVPAPDPSLLNQVETQEDKGPKALMALEYTDNEFCSPKKMR